MGIWDKVKEGVGKAADNVQAELARRKQERAWKEQLLSKFSGDDLRSFCRYYDYNVPNRYDEDARGRSHKIPLERSDYFNYIIGCSLDKIKDYAEYNKELNYKTKTIRTEIDKVRGTFEESSMSLQTKENIENSKAMMTGKKEIDVQSESATEQNGFDLLLDDIDNNFILQPPRDEKDFENQLYQFLSARRGEKAVSTQVGTSKGEKIDIVIDNKYALELKLLTNVNVLRNLIGQVLYYKKSYKDVAVILADIGANVSNADIKEFEETSGAKTVIKRASLRGKRNGRGLNLKIGKF